MLEALVRNKSRHLGSWLLLETQDGDNGQGADASETVLSFIPSIIANKLSSMGVTSIEALLAAEPRRAKDNNKSWGHTSLKKIAALQVFYFELSNISNNGKSINYPIVDRPVFYFDFSERTSNCLYEAGVSTIGQLQNLSESELLALPSFGQTCLTEVRSRLKAIAALYSSYRVEQSTWWSTLVPTKFESMDFAELLIERVSSGEQIAEKDFLELSSSNQRHFTDLRVQWKVLFADNPAAAAALSEYNNAHSGSRLGNQPVLGLQVAKKKHAFLGWPSNDLAWSLATNPKEEFRDGEMAVQYALTACETVDWRYWGFIDTLAAALAEVGEFKEAIRLAEAARKMAPESDHKVIDESIRLYRDGLTLKD